MEDTDKTVTDSEASAKDSQEAKLAVTGEEEGLDEEGKAKEEEHKERSRLGRRVSAIEEEVDYRNRRIDGMLEKMEGFLSSTSKTSNYESEVNDMPLTKKDFDRLTYEREKRRREDRTRYESNYLQHIKRLGQSEDPDLHDEIYGEMMKNFNVRHSSDPVADAERNYYRATRAVLKKASPKKEVPLKGEKAKGAGVGGDTVMKEKEAALPELDEYAKEYVKSRGLSEEKVRKALKAGTPFGIAK